MHWNGETIVDLERRFLDTNGVRVVVDAKVVDKDVKLPEERQTSAETLEADTLGVLSDLNHASQKACRLSLIALLDALRLITHLVVATNLHQLRLLCRSCQFNTV